MILDSKNLVYKAVYHGARSFVEVFSTLEVEGWENVPTGACLFAANHQSMVDPPLLGSCLPREISYIARRSLFYNPLFGAVIRSCNSIPVDRGEADVGAIRAALGALADNRGLLIFPEGTRSFDGIIKEPKAGAGLLACKSGVPVVPIHIRGARDILPRGSFFPTGAARLRIRFGKP
ncbi:MAG: lysophospholipid acyltransferase family protein, partial [bacterium]